jgi:CubicO group peptidase (beta-lactamase class C family)
MRFADPAEAGFSPAKLEAARDYYKSLDAAGALLIYDGAVLASWGDVERRFMCHSVRKSFMSAAYGARVDSGDIDLDQTLEQLGIDDHVEGVEPLTDVEKGATILHLLQARSGVYRLAAYEPPNNPKPDRHSHAPGTNWCYNNWDFNTLVTIFMQEVGEFFSDFQKTIATPIGMQDYRPRDGYLHLQADMSEHPAYPFRMSARDMARFGLLYLRDGHWGAEQVLSEDWVERSQVSYSEAWGGGGYGLLWWISGDPQLKEVGMYSALGSGGHAIDVLPGAKLVLAFRVDTFARRQVSSRSRETLLKMILDAQDGVAVEQPELVPTIVGERTTRVIRDFDPNDFVGRIDSGPGSGVRVWLSPEQTLVVDLPQRGSFDLTPLGGQNFFAEDMNLELILELDTEGVLSGLLSEQTLTSDGYARLQGGDVEGALEILGRCAREYPNSANAHDSYGEALEADGQLQAALERYTRAVELATGTGDSNLPVFRENLRRVQSMDTVPSDAQPSSADNSPAT